MFLDKRNQVEVEVPEQIDIAFHILNYNQGLIQFADSKANALLLINSIFIAALTPFIERLGHNSLVTVIGVAFFIFSIISILLSLGVIMTRSGGIVENRTKTLVFYGHIIDNNSPEGYLHEFSAIEAKKFKDSILENIFTVSKIANAKFSIYNQGQTMTLLSCLLWIITILAIPFI
ncbi:MAG TPA: DUF5706 domain-containing protein [Candidatus Ozemobacteraceae bacterium]|nr:DUF5706 domain-containing protein [Candidatus Ozemobacteraceae bacterium]